MTPILPLLPLLLLPLYGYLDPGSGSVLLAMLFSSVSLLYFALRGCYHKGKSLFLKMLHREASRPAQRCQLLIYSEGKSYWTLFQPLLQELLHHTPLQCSYWSSDAADPGLALQHPRLITQYIGQGHPAFLRLNHAHAELCLLTTPGLDVLQIRRSRGVRHYCHLIHSPQDLASYQLFSFDFFDSVLVSGPHQIASLRMLESKRGTPAKQLIPTGLCYYDSLLSRLAQLPASKTASDRLQDRPNNRLKVLVAPTWREASLLHQGGAELLKTLLQAGFSVTLRPHPQSWKQERPLLDALLETLRDYPQLEVDRADDNFTAMQQADVMVSDFSGIVFDFLFVFEKPAFTLIPEQMWRGYEWIDFEQAPWEISAIEQLGLRLQLADLVNLPQLLQHIQGNQAWLAQLRQLRQNSLYHFGQASPEAARQIQLLLAQKESP